MNKVVLMGRLTRDPDIRYSAGENSAAVARYTLAVERKYKKEKETNADFIGCVAFGRNAEFAEKYLRQGLRILITGRIQTGSYTNREGVKIYTTDIVVEEQEFAESKNQNKDVQQGPPLQEGRGSSQLEQDEDGFMKIPDVIDEELPFS